MRINYIGSDAGISGHRLNALRRLGHEVFFVNPRRALPKAKVADYWLWRFGGPGFDRIVGRYLRDKLQDRPADVCWVDCGELIGATSIAVIKRAAPRTLCFCQDNPFVERDGRRWKMFHESLEQYDLFVAPRRTSADNARIRGVRNVLQVMFSADEVAHRPTPLAPADEQNYRSQVSFVGTWMPERGPFAEALIKRGIPLRIFGPRWQKAAEYERLAPYIKLGKLNDVEYVKAVAATDIAIALLSKGNEDLHTTRSIEIPFIGSLLCGERTADHLAMYKENEEAVFFEDADECAEICFDLLKDPDRIRKIAAAGRLRCLQNGYFNERIVEQVIQAAIK